MDKAKVEELKGLKDVLIATNEQDVEIAKIRKEIAVISANLGHEFQKLELERQYEQKKLESVLGTVEFVSLSAMVLGGYIYSVGKRSEANKYQVEYGVTNS